MHSYGHKTMYYLFHHDCIVPLDAATGLCCCRAKPCSRPGLQPGPPESDLSYLPLQFGTGPAVFYGTSVIEDASGDAPLPPSFVRCLALEAKPSWLSFAFVL